MGRGIAMAIEAELHRQSLGAVGQRHGVDTAMAFDATNALCDVDVVTEEDIPGSTATRFQFNDLFSARLARTGASIGAPVQICEWQVMQVWVGGRPARGPSATDVWQ